MADSGTATRRFLDRARGRKQMKERGKASFSARGDAVGGNSLVGSV